MLYLICRAGMRVWDQQRSEEPGRSHLVREKINLVPHIRLNFKPTCPKFEIFRHLSALKAIKTGNLITEFAILAFEAGPKPISRSFWGPNFGLRLSIFGRNRKMFGRFCAPASKKRYSNVYFILFDKYPIKSTKTVNRDSVWEGHFEAYGHAVKGSAQTPLVLLRLKQERFCQSLLPQLVSFR